MKDPGILFLCPFKAEAKVLAALLPECRQADARHWKCKGGQIYTWNGAGEQPLLAALADQQMPAGFNRFILFGSAGALAPEIETGRFFAAGEVTDGETSLVGRVPTGFEPAKILTVKRAIFEPGRRLKAWQKTGAELVDMEAFYFIRHFATTGQAAAVIRFVSDTADEPFSMPFSQGLLEKIAGQRKLFAELPVLGLNV